MSQGPMIAGIFWVLAATVTALLPMRRQYIPGFALLIAAPLLLGWIWVVHGVFSFALCLVAFLSMFRNPLIYLWHRATGRATPLSSEET